MRTEHQPNNHLNRLVCLMKFYAYVVILCEIGPFIFESRIDH